MANGVIIPSSNDFEIDNSISQVRIVRDGNLVQFSALAWKTASLITIPSGFRPKNNTYFVCEQRNGSNISIDRIVINTNGTITLSGSNVDFVGSFTYYTV